MELKSMKSKVEALSSQPVLVPDKEVYPYGLQLRLENDQLLALGITESPTVGDLVKLMAKAKVVSVSLREETGEKDICVCLQITDMATEMSGSEKEQIQPDVEEKSDEKMVEGDKYSEKFYGYMG